MPTARRSVAQQIARDIAARIGRGEVGYQPGWVLTAHRALAHELGHTPKTIAAAYNLLAEMGLVTIREGYGVVVRTPRDREIIHLPAGTVVTARMPTFAELDQWDLEPGVPMLVADGGAWPADRYQLVVGRHDGAAPSES